MKDFLKCGTVNRGLLLGKTDTPICGLIKISTEHNKIQNTEMGQLLPFHWMPKSAKVFGFRGLCPLTP